MSSTRKAALGTLPAGTVFRLHREYRDGTDSRLRYGRTDLVHDLVVTRHQGDVTVCRTGRLEVPLWGGLRIAL